MRLSLHPVLEATFEELLARWRRHDELRRTGGSLFELATSRHQLDEIRNQAHRLRQALNPMARELEEVALAAHCDTLEALVFFRYNQAEPGPEGVEYQCICGERVG